MDVDEVLNEIDAECTRLGLPPLSRLVTDIPGRPDATLAEVQEVFDAADRGEYEYIYKKFRLN